VRIITTSGPVAEPYDLTEAKELLRIPVSDTEEDTTLEMVIAAARRAMENFCACSLQTQTIAWTMNADEADPTGPVRVPRGPVSALTSLVVYDGEGVATTYAVNGDGALVDADDEVIGELVGDDLLVPRNDGWDAPGREHGAAVLTYDAGYGAAAESIPEDLRTAVGVTLTDFWEHRESIVVGTIVAKVPATAQAQAWYHRRGLA
jgi:uncharacterized phiE125 gp8 family phage protein